MSVQFKFKDGVDEGRRKEIIAALGHAGFEARCLFPKRPRLASIFTVSGADAGDLTAVRSVLTRYDAEIEYLEAAPKRRLRR